jgi:hypothetical protein
MYLVFSVFTARPTSLLASIKVCVLIDNEYMRKIQSGEFSCYRFRPPLSHIKFEFI